MTDAHDKIEKMVGHIRQIPTLPANVERITELLGDDNATMEGIGKEIATDQTLSAQVLRLINSSFYGCSSRVTAVTHAVVLLGLGAVKNLITSSWISEIIEKSFPGIFDHSMACATTCFVLARNLGGEEPENMSTVGLLHDIGKVILAEHLPDEFNQVTQKVRETNGFFVDAEMSVLGVTHADMAAWLLKRWRVPDAVGGAIAHHHTFDPEHPQARQTAMLILADTMTRAEGFGWPGDHRMPDLGRDVMALLELEPADLRMLMDEIVDQLQGLERLTAVPVS